MSTPRNTLQVDSDDVHCNRSASSNGHCKSFNAKLRDELLNGEVFYTLEEASVVIEQ